MTTYDHLYHDFRLRPRQIAAHLREAHGIEPKVMRKGYEREGWHDQHEEQHETGVSGYRKIIPSAHTLGDTEDWKYPGWHRRLSERAMEREGIPSSLWKFVAQIGWHDPIPTGFQVIKEGRSYRYIGKRRASHFYGIKGQTNPVTALSLLAVALLVGWGVRR